MMYGTGVAGLRRQGLRPNTVTQQEDCSFAHPCASDAMVSGLGVCQELGCGAWVSGRSFLRLIVVTSRLGSAVQLRTGNLVQHLSIAARARCQRRERPGTTALGDTRGGRASWLGFEAHRPHGLGACGGWRRNHLDQRPLVGIAALQPGTGCMGWRRMLCGRCRNRKCATPANFVVRAVEFVFREGDSPLCVNQCWRPWHECAGEREVLSPQPFLAMHDSDNESHGVLLLARCATASEAAAR